MPPMPLEVKLATIGIIVLLGALIAAYHLWLDRRAHPRETTSPARPSPAAPAASSVTPPPRTGGASGMPRPGGKRSSLRRVR